MLPCGLDVARVPSVSGGAYLSHIEATFGAFPLGDGFQLLVQRLRQSQAECAHPISPIRLRNSRGVLIDISALEIVDSFIGRMIANISGMARVLDAETVVVGMQPAVAITLVELGLSLTGVRTALNVEKGMSLLRASLEARGGGNGHADDED